MIKFLISFLLFLFIYSCNELQNDKINSKLNESIIKIDNVIKNNKNIIKELPKKNLVNQNNIFYYVGDPYYIEGVKYVPKENYNYSEIGLSTFYGKELHNVKTVNNDLNKVTELLGRHKTLPIPSMVKITNLDNGLSINIKIIDRHDNNAYLIEVSRKVAQLLGFYKDKVATVRVDILSDASKQWKNVSISINQPEFNDTITSAPTDIVSISSIDDSITSNENDSDIIAPIELSSEDIADYKLYLKIYNFENYSDIEAIISEINLDLNYTSEKNNSLYDLTIGPLDKMDVNNLVSYFISKGYKETKIITN